MSDKKGTHDPSINSQANRHLAAKSKPLTQAMLAKIISDHHEFLKNGGAGGKWKTILLQGCVFGIYDGPEIKKGQPASFEHRYINATLDLSEIALPFSNWCGVSAKNLKACGIELSHALLTDAHLTNANFHQARLCNVDFSRSNLRGANFREADCAGADFENCDLRGADFRGTRLTGARFPGAYLDGVKY